MFELILLVRPKVCIAVTPLLPLAGAKLQHSYCRFLLSHYSFQPFCSLKFIFLQWSLKSAVVNCYSKTNQIVFEVFYLLSEKDRSFLQYTETRKMIKLQFNLKKIFSLFTFYKLLSQSYAERERERERLIVRASQNFCFFFYFEVTKSLRLLTFSINKKFCHQIQHTDPSALNCMLLRQHLRVFSLFF